MKPHSFFLVFVCSIKELKSTIQNKFKGDRMQVTLQNVWVTFRNIQSLGSLCRIKNIFKIIAFILFPLISLQVHSANTVQTTGYISKIRTFTSGTATYNTNDIGITNIYVDSLAGACGSNEKRVAILFRKVRETRSFLYFTQFNGIDGTHCCSIYLYVRMAESE